MPDDPHLGCLSGQAPRKQSGALQLPGGRMKQHETRCGGDAAENSSGASVLDFDSANPPSGRPSGHLAWSAAQVLPLKKYRSHHERRERNKHFQGCLATQPRQHSFRAPVIHDDRQTRRKVVRRANRRDEVGPQVDEPSASGSP